MKTCPFCAEEIQEAAIVCKHCGRDLQSSATAQQVTIVQPAKKTSGCAWAALILVVLGILFMTWCSVAMSRVASSLPTSGATSTSDNSSAAKPMPASPVLEILSKRGSESEGGGYMIVEGEVRNLTDTPMKSIQVVASWYDNSGKFITSDSAMIDYDPLMPGQKSPFKTMSRANPLMKRFSVEFKPMFGSPLNVRDSDK